MNKDPATPQDINIDSLDQVEEVVTPVVQQASGWRRAVYLTLAGFFFALGALGAVLPGLPTTPFLLLASFFLIRTSPRLHRALLRSRFFGPILVDWQVHGGIRPAVRMQAIVVVLLAVLFSLYLSRDSWIIMSVIFTLASVGLVVILKLPTASVVSASVERTPTPRS